jgi:uncharacterized protein
MDAGLRQALLDYLTTHNTMTLATAGVDGPAAAALFYVHDEQFRLYFLSETKAAHVANLRADARGAVTIHDDYRDWRVIQGVQMRGAARAIQLPLELARATRLYLTKYPFLEEFMANPRRAGERLTWKLASSRLFVFEPRWLRWIDNPSGFGARREYDVEVDVEVTRGR